MDLLSRALQALHPHGAACYRRVFRAPWELRGADGPAAYYVVLEGRCLLETEESEPVWLEAGDTAVLPRGAAHTLRDAPETLASPVEVLTAAHAPEAGGVLRVPGAGPQTTLVCGFVAFTDAVTPPLLAALPPLIVVRRAQRAGMPWLEHTLAFLTRESQGDRPGASATMAHLSCVLFVQALRAYLDEAPADARGWLCALRDAQISRVLMAVHAAPAAPWTVAALAAEAGMSRSAFAVRFRALVGEPPLQYVTRWRMHEAARLLRSEPATLAEIAERVGYASEAAFGRVFKRYLNRAPGRYRRQARAGLHTRNGAIAP